MTKDFAVPMEDIELSFTGEKIARDVTEDLKSLLYTTLRDHLRLRSVVTLQDLEDARMPNVTLRLTTVQRIFDGIREGMQEIARSSFLALKQTASLSPREKLGLTSTVLFGPYSQGLTPDEESDGADGDAETRLSELVDNWEDVLDKGAYGKTLHDIGERVGWSFALNLIRHARVDRKEIPLDYSKLLQYWAVFDSATDLAERIDVDLGSESKRLSVTIKNSFLLREKSDPTHVHCAFLRGYVLGVVDGLFLNWFHWIMLEPYRYPQALRVASVEEVNPKADSCEFKVSLYGEHNAAPASSLSSAVVNMQRGALKEAAMDARVAFEQSLRVGMDLDKNSQLKVTAYLKSAKECNLPITYKRFHDLWDNLSALHHNRLPASFAQVSDFLLEVWQLTRQIPRPFDGPQQAEMNKKRAKWLVSNRQRIKR